MDFFRLAASACVVLLATTTAYARQLGVIGTTYPILEQNALTQIMSKLKQMEVNGELKRLEEEAKRRALNSIKNPRGPLGIGTVRKSSVRVFDPSVTYTEGIFAEDGTVIAAPNTTVNPLDHIQLSKTLVFFNGDDQEQVVAVGQLLKTYQTAIRPVLVSGSWLDLSRQWQTQVYFDQGGSLSERFSIQNVPTIVRQVGNMLEIAEIPAGELK